MKRTVNAQEKPVVFLSRLLMKSTPSASLNCQNFISARQYFSAKFGLVTINLIVDLAKVDCNVPKEGMFCS